MSDHEVPKMSEIAVPGHLSRVRLEWSDGTFAELIDPAECQRWEMMASAQVGMAHVHGMKFKPLSWVTGKISNEGEKQMSDHSCTVRTGWCLGCLEKDGFVGSLCPHNTPVGRGKTSAGGEYVLSCGLCTTMFSGIDKDPIFPVPRTELAVEKLVADDKAVTVGMLEFEREMKEAHALLGGTDQQTLKEAVMAAKTLLAAATTFRIGDFNVKFQDGAWFVTHTKEHWSARGPDDLPFWQNRDAAIMEARAYTKRLANAGGG